MEYELTIALIKESTFDKPFVQARCKGSLSLGDLVSSENVGLMDMIKSRSFSENPINIFGLIEPCKKQAISRYKSGNKKSDFYKSYPIDDIKDRLYDLSDELGINGMNIVIDKLKRHNYSINQVRDQDGNDYVATLME
jgi:hypothetical protein